MQAERQIAWNRVLPFGSNFNIGSSLRKYKRFGNKMQIFLKVRTDTGREATPIDRFLGAHHWDPQVVSFNGNHLEAKLAGWCESS